MPEVRSPARAGQFYPASSSALENKIEECFTHRLGPGEIPELDGGERRIKGAIVPHAGYDFSGPVAAHVYGAIARDGFPDTFVILGTSHMSSVGVAPAAVTRETFDMPMGEVPVDQDLVDDIVGGSVEVDSRVHSMEHSLEVQLPFIQYFSQEIKFVPIAVSSHNLSVARELGGFLSEAIKNRDVLIIASTDFTHCGPRYGQLPPSGESAGEFAREQDKKAIEKINNLDIEGLFEVIEEHNITMCGPGGVGAMINAVEDEVSGGELLKYTTSQDIVSSQDAVGYGGIILR